MWIVRELENNNFNLSFCQPSSLIWNNVYKVPGYISMQVPILDPKELWLMLVRVILLVENKN